MYIRLTQQQEGELSMTLQNCLHPEIKYKEKLVVK